jgi:hypothetical protein
VDPQVKFREDRTALIAATREAADLGTFKDLLAAYVAKLKKAEKASWREVERLFVLHVEKPWPELIVSAGLKLHDFSRSGHAGLLRPSSSIAS